MFDKQKNISFVASSGIPTEVAGAIRLHCFEDIRLLVKVPHGSERDPVSL